MTLRIGSFMLAKAKGIDSQLGVSAMGQQSDLWESGLKGFSGKKSGGKTMAKAILSTMVRILGTIGFLLSVAAGPSMGQTTVAPELESSDFAQSAAVQQQKWLNASPEERVKIAEQIGEEGARQYAHQQGWKPIFEGHNRTMPQGPDLIYWDNKRGKVVVLEAKGGTSPINRGYGYEQGTPEWAVKSAESVIHNPKASVEYKAANRMVIEAAQKGNLKVGVVRTEHVMGIPKGTRLEMVASCTPEAQRIAQEVAKKYQMTEPFDMEGYSGRGTSSGIKKATQQVSRNSKELQTVGRGMQRTTTTQRAASRSIDAAEDALSAAKGTSKGLSAAGKYAGPVAVVAEAGLSIHRSYEIEEAYKRGEISEQQRNRAHVKNLAQTGGGAAGAYVGTEAGAAIGAGIGTAICPGIGTAIGGIVGGLLGGFGGSWAGEKAAGATVDAIME